MRQKTHIYFRAFFFFSSECLCSLFRELSSGNYLFCFFTLQTANGSQPGLNPTLLCPAVITGFERKPILWNAVRAHACRAAGPTCRAGKPDPTEASPATFQPRKPFLSNCYLSNRSTRHLGLGQMCACSHEMLNLQTFDLSAAPENPSIIFARADRDPKDDF